MFRSTMPGRRAHRVIYGNMTILRRVLYTQSQTEYFNAKPISMLNPPIVQERSMVDKIRRKGGAMYVCEVCGFGYRELEIAEECEEYCDMHGSYSPEIHNQAISKPTAPVMSLTA
jgi:hypothetical protein